MSYEDLGNFSQRKEKVERRRKGTSTQHIPEGIKLRSRSWDVKARQISLYINTEQLAGDPGCQPRAKEMAFMRAVVQDSRWVTGLDGYQQHAVWAQAVHRWSETGGSQLPLTSCGAFAANSWIWPLGSLIIKARWVRSVVGKPKSSEPKVPTPWFRDALVVGWKGESNWAGLLVPFSGYSPVIWVPNGALKQISFGRRNKSFY